MTIGSRISLVYSAMTILLVVTVGMACWLAVGNYCERLYFRHLEEKARFVAMERFEKDELDYALYQQIVERRINAISTDRWMFIDMADSTAHAQLAEYLSEKDIRRLMTNKVLHTKRDMGTQQTDDDETCAAIVYDDNEGTFAVLVFSHNPYVGELSVHIGLGLLAAVLVTAVLLYLLSRLYAARTVNDIDRAYQTERLFVNNASHEINNPLTAIQGECDVALMSDRKPEEYRRSLTLIAKETDRIVRIIQQLLLLSHKAASPQKGSWREVKLSEVLLPFANGQVSVDIQSDFTVSIPEEQLRIALQNLVDNARKYSDGKPVVLRAIRHEVEIIDHGIGIPATDLPHIFAPFHRAANATGHPGHGIGLSLAKTLLERHGATLAVKSTGKDGTIFVIKF